MKSEFKAKFLQNLVRKNKGNEGFTLIELLVVIIIVGVLAAIALPSFLNQIGKARGSEAKSSIGTINRSQQAYRLENNTMAASLTLLDAKVTGKFYTYAVAATSANGATVRVGANEADLKGYASLATQNGDEFQQTICESAATVAITNPAGGIAVPTGYNACADGTNQKQID